MLDWIILGTIAVVFGIIILWALVEGLKMGRAEKIDRLRRELNRLEREEQYQPSKKKQPSNAVTKQTQIIKLHDIDNDATSDNGDSDSSDGDSGGGDGGSD